MTKVFNIRQSKIAEEHERHPNVFRYASLLTKLEPQHSDEHSNAEESSRLKREAEYQAVTEKL